MQSFTKDEKRWSGELVELMCCVDERDKVQKKTFTKWINQHLMKVRKHVNDLYEDLRDGHNLISLLEVLSGDTLPRERDFLKTLRLPREKGRMRFHRLQNVQIALDYLKKRQVKLVNIRNDDITDGNPKLTLGLIWTIILHFQVSLVLLGNLFLFRFLHTFVMNGSTLDLKTSCTSLHYVSNVYLKVVITVF
ncbi:plectin-like [Meleagris gallopavo]|uniref:plectin-like n=1 Tax=Meleagris gallopavo TaxID=9103 RepID=UPI0012AC42BF|nr:plectin-like [Meleagris gallopavo]